MSTRSASTETGMQQQIRDILTSFSGDCERTGGALLQLQAGDPAGFLAAALPVLNHGLDPSSSASLVQLVAGTDSFAEALCDPDLFTLERAVLVARLGAGITPLLDVELARKLRDLDAPSIERVLALLDEISDGSRTVFMLSHLMRHSSAHIRSKTALLIGRAMKRAEWVESQLEKSDARERANAVEALWGMNSAEANAVFRKALNDPSLRVAANAMIGLYRLGDPAALSLILKMSRRPEPACLSAAAWAMGETGDPRFLSALAQMDAGAAPGVGRNIAHAIERIEAAQAGWVEKGHVRVHLAHARVLSGGSRRLQLAISMPGGAEAPRLSATQCVIWENSRPVFDYCLEPHQSTERLIVAFPLPYQPWLPEEYLWVMEESVLACLKNKRSSDWWAVAKQPGQIIRFMPDKATLWTAITGPSSPVTNISLLVDFWNRLIKVAATIRGSRSLIAVTDPAPPGEADLEPVLRSARKGEVAIHLVAVGNFPRPHPLEALCRETGGIFLDTTSTDQIPALYQEIYASQLSRYDVSYRLEGERSPDAPSVVRLQLHTDQGYGEASVELLRQ